jgi:ribose-phosphate pyrophosphokinase
VLENKRLGDRVVKVSLNAIPLLEEHTPVLIDDIIASGETMLEAARMLRERHAVPPVCVAAHGIFAGRALEAFAENKLRGCEQFDAAYDAIDISGLLAEVISGTACD